MCKPVISQHPFEPFVPEGATKLIIGTIPPFRFCTSPPNLLEGDVNFYYGSKDNRFWKVLAQITDSNLEYANTANAIEQRKNILKKLNVGITDIIDQCIHKNGLSSDKDLTDIKQKPLDSLLNQFPEIDTLIYTSQFVKGQVNKQADKGYHDNQTQTVTIKGKKYNVIILYSPSPSARGVADETLVAQYRSVFGD